jgi:hypothetical protein
MLYLLSIAENLSVPNMRSMPNIMKANSPAVVTCMGLTKIYQTGTVALDNLTLTIEPGMCFGLMGENGAGKSTLVKLLMGFIFPTNGQLSVLGETEARRAHTRIGYLHERPYVELRFTARSYLTYLAQLSGLSSRASYSRGLMLAAAILRFPIFIFRLLLVLLAHRLINPTAEKMFIGAIGLLPTTILVSVLTVALSSPIATRLMRILFLTWIAVVLFSTSPIFIIPTSVLNILGIVPIPLWPISACYQVSVSGTISLTGVLGMLLVAVYIIGLALVAGKWLERRELLLY